MVSVAYPRGGNSVALRALSPRDCQRVFRSLFSPFTLIINCTIEWIQEIEHACKRARRAEEKASRKSH